MSKNPTASGLHRAERCPASYALPQVQHESADASRGHAGHRFLELVPKLGREKARAEVPEEHRAMCEAIDLEGLPLGQWCRQEVAFAYDLETGKARELGAGLGRAYGELRPTEIAGTIDVTSGNIDGTSGCEECLDFKFDGYDSTALPPTENPQLLFAALCSGATRGTLIHIRTDGSHWSESADYDAFSLDAFAGRLEMIYKGVVIARDAAARGLPLDVFRGSWCRYCAAASSCPAVTSLLRAVSAEPNLSAAVLRGQIEPATAKAAYLRMTEIKEALKSVETALYLYASENPIDLGDGQVYGPVKVPRDELDARIVRKVLAERYGPEAADAACDFDTSKAAVERAMRNVRTVMAESSDKPPTLKALKEEALAAIAKAGGLKQTMKESVRAHRVSGATLTVEEVT